MQWKKIQRKPLSKKKKRLIFVAVAGSLLVLAAGYTVFIAPLLKKEQWIYKEELVERGTLKAGVSESGSLEYGITSILYNLDLDVSGGEDDEDAEEESVQKYLKIAKISVVPGQRIVEGDVLMAFTPDSIDGVRLLLKDALAGAQTAYAEAQAEYELSALEVKSDYEGRKLDEQYAASIYGNARQSVDNEITAIQVEINQRTANTASLQKKTDEAAEAYNEIRGDFESAQKPVLEKDSNTVSFMAMQKEYLNLQTQYESAKSALTSAQQALEDNAAQIASLQRELAAASARKELSRLDVEETYQEGVINGANAQIDYDAQLESLKETLQEAEKEKDKIQKQLDDFEAFVGADGCLYADGTGIVTEVAYADGDRLKAAGILVSYAVPTDMAISVDVAQEDVVDLKVGDRVDITFTAYQDAAYTGSIKSIDTTATAAGSNTVSYAVIIAVEGDASRLYGGMTADIIFVTEQKEDVLYISRKAIVKENGKTCVYYKTRLGGMELKEVETGLDNGVDVEILSGLEEGDTIYLASRVSSEEAVMSSNAQAAQEGSASGSAAGNAPGSMPGGTTGNPPGNVPGNVPGGQFPQAGSFGGGMLQGGAP